MATKPLITLGIRQNVHSENEIKMWKDLWIPKIPARPARPIAPVLHPIMPVSSLMIGNPKRWNTEMLENYVHQEDITLIQSLTISQDYCRDGYC